MALPCFLPDERELAGQLRALLAERGLDAAPEAFAWLEANLGGDRALTRGEIEKLALYLADAPEPAGRRSPTSRPWSATARPSGSTTRSTPPCAATGQRSTRALDRLLAEGEAPQRVVRATAGFLLRALAAAGRGGGRRQRRGGDRGRPGRRSISASEPLIGAAVRRWSGDALVDGAGAAAGGRAALPAAPGRPRR